MITFSAGFWMTLFVIACIVGICNHIHTMHAVDVLEIELADQKARTAHFHQICGEQRDVIKTYQLIGADK